MYIPGNTPKITHTLGVSLFKAEFPHDGDSTKNKMPSDESIHLKWKNLDNLSPKATTTSSSSSSSSYSSFVCACALLAWEKKTRLEKKIAAGVCVISSPGLIRHVPHETHTDVNRERATNVFCRRWKEPGTRSVRSCWGTSRPPTGRHWWRGWRPFSCMRDAKRLQYCLYKGCLHVHI